jgi:hypothetical protein
MPDQPYRDSRITLLVLTFVTTVALVAAAIGWLLW